MDSIIEKSKHKEYVKINRDGKTFYQLRDVGTNETGEEKQGKVDNYLQSIITPNLNERQKKYLEWQLKNSKMCHVTKTPKNIEEGFPLQKQCYKNAIEVCMINSDKDVKYCEGYITFFGIVIELAWNKIGDKYFDVTSDGPLKGRETKLQDYTSIIELNNEEVSKLLLELETYGPFIPAVYSQVKDK